MSDNRYILERGTRKFKACPQCGKKEFTRYIDTENNNEYLADHVGRCNRENKCNYHYPPKQYFQDNNLQPTEGTGYRETREAFPAKIKVNIPFDVLTSTMKAHAKNGFVKYLHTLFEPYIVNMLIDKYNIGTSNGAGWWNGKEGQPMAGAGESTVFWFVNKDNRVRSGQIKLFDGLGHTASFYHRKDDEYKKCTTYVHYLLSSAYERAGQALPEWLKGYIDYGNDYKNLDCFFGEHLLSNPKYTTLPVAIVEAPKSAIIASVFFPQYLWLAVGALSYLTTDRCEVLRGRKVILFPDLNAYNVWKQRARDINHITSIAVSDFLEKIATPEQKIKSWDIADYLATPAVKEELINKFIAKVCEATVTTDSIVYGIINEFIDKGLKSTDIKTGLELLQSTYGFTAVECRDLHPYYYDSTIKIPEYAIG